MTITIGMASGNRGRMSRGRSQRNATPPAQIARVGVRDAVAMMPTRINAVGAHQTRENDLASATPIGKVTREETPSAIG